MSAPWSVDWAGAHWVLVRHRGDVRLTCTHCGKVIRPNTRYYRTKDWGDTRSDTHQRCLLGQIDPSIYDIKGG